MLKEITIKNFRSFNEETTFSMEADYSRVSEHKNHIVEVNDNKILKVSSMYGPNGGGKTNLIKAIMFSKIMIESNRIIKNGVDYKCLYSDSDIIEETLFFVTDNYEIGYNFEISYSLTDFNQEWYNNLKKLDLNIISETISYREKGKQNFQELVYRDNKGYIESSLSKKINLPQLALGLSALLKLYDDYANNEFNNDVEATVIRTLYNELNSICILSEPGVVNYDLNLINKYKEQLIKSLNNLDVKITNIKTYDNNSNAIYFEREVLVNGHKKKKDILLLEESEGTKKIFNILYKLLGGKLKNKIYLCDDMNSYLHPKLVEAIISLFNSQKNTSCQLIFNSHDLTIMNNELFRRDEIWFAYINDNYSTELLSLANVVNYNGECISKNGRYYKDYLEGKYGI